MNKNENVSIIGAGPVGCLLSLFLAKHGISSTLYEKRSDIRKLAHPEGRSINLAISARGLYALSQVGLKDIILEKAIPMKGRMIHSQTGNLTFQPYSVREQDCIYSLSRAWLNQTLLSNAEATGHVKTYFHYQLVSASVMEKKYNFQNIETNECFSIHTSPLFATDGSGSTLRNELIKTQGYECDQSNLDYGYKELLLPAGRENTFQMEKNALHIWPRGNFMLIALPNCDGSFTCTLFLPFQGEWSFSKFQTRAVVSQFFQEQFPDILPLIPNLEEQFFSNPTGHMATVKCSPWNYSGDLLLLGDAAHAIVPFFGQGMNCGFEDCTIFNDLLTKYNSWHDIFSHFSILRKQNADRIADMALENFIEMRDKVGQSKFQLQKCVEAILQREFPEEYLSRYFLVTFSRVPYSDAYKAGTIQEDILSVLCADLQAPEDVNLVKARELIHSKLKPILEVQKE